MRLSANKRDQKLLKNIRTDMKLAIYLIINLSFMYEQQQLFQKSKEANILAHWIGNTYLSDYTDEMIKYLSKLY